MRERKGAWYGSVCDAARSGMGLMLEREEFQAAMVRVYAGLDDINAHLRELNGRTGRSEGRLTVVETVGKVAGAVVTALWAVWVWVTR